MSSMQSMLNVYFHMKNHYRKLKNVQSRVNTNNPRHSAGQPKKLCTKTKGSGILGFSRRETSKRPPTRRNLNDVLSMDTVGTTTTSRSKNSKDKFKTTVFDHDTPRETQIDVGEHEYLQFSLRITEEIIKSDMYTNEDMIRVLKHHYRMNKHRLNQEKLLKTVAELCGELNIQLTDKLVRYLNDDNTITVSDKDCTHNHKFTPTSLPQHDLNTDPPDFEAIVQNEINSSHTFQDELIPFTTPSTKIVESLKGKLSLQLINKLLKEIEDGQKPSEPTSNPTSRNLLSEPFQFGEEILKAPGVDSASSDNSESKLRDFEIIHDGRTMFDRDSCKDSQMSMMPAQGKLPEKNLVVTHYVTSLEPKITEMKEFSTQTVVAADDEKVDGEVMDDEKNVEEPPPTEVSCSSVTISTPTCPNVISYSQCDTQTTNCDSRTILQPNNCKRCNCLKDPDESITITTNDQEYIVLDCPVLIPRNHSKSIEFLNSLVKTGEMNHGSVNIVDSTVKTTNNSVKTTMGQPGFSLDYDLTPQKEMYQNNDPLSIQHANPSQMPLARCSCISTSIDTNKLLTNYYDKIEHWDIDRNERIERYKDVREKLSYFYPTTATQVSSMDLLSNQIIHPQADLPNEYTTDSRDNLEQYDNSLSYVDSDSKISKPCDKSLSTPILKPPLSPLSKRMRERTRLILDNYLVEVEHAKNTKPQSSPIRANQTFSRHSGTNCSVNNPLSVTHSQGDHAGEKLTNSFIMERRIQSLLYDIERYSKDDGDLPRKDLTSKRNNMLEVLRRRSTLSSLPSETPKRNQVALVHK